MRVNSIEECLADLTGYLRSGDLSSAAVLSEELLSAYPEDVSTLLAVSQVRQQQGDFAGMRKLAETALTLDRNNPDTIIRTAECRLYDGDVSGALEILYELENKAGRDHSLLQSIAQMYVHCGQHERASRCYQRAVDLQPSNPCYVYNLASTRIALGNMEQAEALLNRVIKLDPQDYDAWQNRSTVRTQTPDNNHVEQLKFVLSELKEKHPGRIPVCFALARELEDLKQYDESFSFLQQGSAQRKKNLGYDVGEDIAAMELIAQTFNAETFESEQAGHESTQPVFVLGLPRSGTTLVDRIICSHSQAESLGEINTLAFSLIQVAGRSGETLQGKRALIEKSVEVDFAELGKAYCTGIAGFGQNALRLVDKTPLNFLYLGLIRLAMPRAKIIHLRRHPADSCYAMYKTLFRMGYPFTYSLQDVGRYYIAYQRLMDHWRKHLPGGFLDVDYERLVTNQETESRRILNYCGLEWERGVLDFYRNVSPAATASAAQVRQPIYTSSVGRWRCYERQLTPLVNKLREHGIGIEID